MNIYVSNINFRTQEENFHQLFAQYGEVISAHIMTDRETGRSRGFGFVEMNDEEGQAAIEALNGYEFEGKVLNVSVARPRAERPERAHGDQNNYRGNRSNNYNRGSYQRNNDRGGYGTRDNYNRGGYQRNNDRDNDRSYHRDNRGYDRNNRGYEHNYERD